MTACPRNGPPQFKAATDRDNQLSWSIEDETAVLDIQSPGGIGNADIELLSGSYPAQITLRLHIKSLEGFKLTYGKTTVSASSSGTADSATESLIQSDGSERAITSLSPWWMEIRPEQEYLEITLPRALIQEKPKSFSLEWVDFYR
jgi:hypothetical protein